MAKQKSQLKIGIILSYVNMLLGNLIPIFYTPVMLRILGQDEYGLYKLASSVTSYLSLISLGIGSAITRYLIKTETEEGKEAEEKMLGLFMVIFQIIAVAAVAVGTALTLLVPVIYGKSLGGEELVRMQILVFIMVCNMALGFSQTPYLSAVNAHEKFVFLQCMNILTTCVGPALNIVMLYAGFASIGMTLSSMLVGLVCRVAYTIYVRRSMHLRPRYKGMPTDKLKEILGFSFWIFVSNVVGQLYNATDTVIIGMIPGLATTGVAVYNVGGMISGVASSLSVGVSSLLAPKVNRLVFSGASNEELSDLAIRVGRIQCLIYVLVFSGFIAFGKPFIYFYCGPEYYDAYWVAILLMLAFTVPLMQSVFLSILVAKNRHQFRALVYLGIAIANVVGTWFMMKFLGVIGAALMTCIVAVMGQGFIMNWYYSKKMKLNIGRFWQNIGKLYVTPCIMCLSVAILARFINFYRVSALCAGIIVYTVVFCAVNWLLVMNDHEKNLVKAPLMKIMCWGHGKGK